MPKILTNQEFLKAALRGARYEDGSPVKRYVKQVEAQIVRDVVPDVLPQPPIVVQQTTMDLQPLIDAVEAIKIESPTRPPMTYNFKVTARDSSGKVASFTVTERAVNG